MNLLKVLRIIVLRENSVNQSKLRSLLFSVFLRNDSEQDR